MDGATQTRDYRVAMGKAAISVVPDTSLNYRISRDDDCPFCGAPIKTSDATIRLNCPTCKRLIEVRDMSLLKGE